jgi:hypothetical protein
MERVPNRYGVRYVYENESRRWALTGHSVAPGYWLIDRDKARAGSWPFVERFNDNPAAQCAARVANTGVSCHVHA